MSIDNESGSHPAFDSEEQRILSEIKPEDDTPVENAQTGQPGDAKPDAAPAGAEAAPNAAAASPAPAAATTDAQPGAGAAAAPGTDTAKPDTPAVVAQEKPQGDTRAALRAARQSEKRLRDELAEARETIEKLKSGDLPTDTSVTDEELERLEQDFPAMAKAIRNQKALEKRLEELTAQPKNTTPEDDFQPLEYAPAVQMVIDDVPDLLAWQHDRNAQDKFQRAIDYDRALSVDPDWKDKPAVERFAEAARRTREKFGMPAGSTPSAGTTPAAKTTVDPATVIANAPAATPMGISDFRGGGPANAPTLNYQNMSDEAILASLPVGD